MSSRRCSSDSALQCKPSMQLSQIPDMLHSLGLGSYLGQTAIEQSINILPSFKAHPEDFLQYTRQLADMKAAVEAKAQQVAAGVRQYQSVAHQLDGVHEAGRQWNAAAMPQPAS